MAQQLGTPAVLPHNPGLIPSSHMMANNQVQATSFFGQHMHEVQIQI